MIDLDPGGRMVRSRGDLPGGRDQTGSGSCAGRASALRFEGKGSAIGLSICTVCRERVCVGLGVFAEDGDDIFDGDDEEAVVAFEVYGDGLFGVEEDAVVLADGVVGVVFDLGGDGDDASCDGGDLDFVGEVDAGLGLLFVFIFADKDTVSDWFDGFEF